MPRIFPAAVAVAAVVAAVAATPAAAQSPASQRPHLFVASLKADLITKWEEPSWTNDGCHVKTVSEASGQQTERIRTAPIRVRVIPALKDAAFGYGSLRKPVGGMAGKGEAKAEHAIFADHSPGLCAIDGYAPADVDDQHQCEDRYMQWTVQMISVKGRIGPVPIAKREAGAMDECTVYKPRDAASIWSKAGMRVPMAEIRNRDQEYVILQGRHQIRETQILDESSGHMRKMSTSVRWTLRMRRAK